MVARMRGLVWIALISGTGIFFAGLPYPPARAASFDCAAATKPLEKLICSDPDLSLLDEAMATAYEAHLPQFSEDARRVVRQGQRSWLKATHAICGYWLDHTGYQGETALDCLKSAYRDRTPAFQPDEHFGPYLFYTVEQYEAVPMSEDSRAGRKGELVRHQLSYPQIDAPRTPETDLWNQRVATGVEGNYRDPGIEAPLDTVDYSVGYNLRTALPGFIAGAFWINCHTRGWPHPNYDSWSSNYLLVTGENLRPDDVFAPQTPWQDDLAMRILPIIKREYPGLEVALADLYDPVSNPGNWTISPDELKVFVDLNRIYGYGNGTSELKVRWRDLKPYLRPDLPIGLTLD